MKPAINKMEPIFLVKRKSAKGTALVKVHAKPDDASKHKQADAAYKEAHIDDCCIG
jgi:hypothetical protein